MTAGVIFDFDGVVVDSEGFWWRASTQVLAELGVTDLPTPQEYARDWIAHGLGPEHAVKRYGLKVTPDEFRRMRAPVVTHLVTTQAPLIHGAAAALERLFPRFPIALATNSRAATVEPILAKFGLRRFFRELLTRERYERAKPEPDAFLAAAAALGLPPARCVVIEDAERGVLAAQRAGMPCIAAPNEWTRFGDFSKADRVVASLDEVTVDLVLVLTAPS